MYGSLAAIKVSDVLAEKVVGVPVNAHVVRSVAPEQPDVERMRELVHGSPSKALRQTDSITDAGPVPKDD